MKITIRGKAHNTRKKPQILMDEQLKASKVDVEDDGTVCLRIDIGPIKTSGNFRGEVRLSISELYHLVGMVEQEKYRSLSEDIREIREEG